MKLAIPWSVKAKSWSPFASTGVVKAAAVKVPPVAVWIVNALAVPNASIELMLTDVPESSKLIVLAPPKSIEVAEANKGIDKDVIIPALAVVASLSWSPSDSSISITSAVVKAAKLNAPSTLSIVRFSTEVKLLNVWVAWPATSAYAKLPLTVKMLSITAWTVAEVIAAVTSISTLPLIMLMLAPRSSKVSRSFTLAIVTSPW